MQSSASAPAGWGDRAQPRRSPRLAAAVQAATSSSIRLDMDSGAEVWGRSDDIWNAELQDQSSNQDQGESSASASRSTSLRRRGYTNPHSHPLSNSVTPPSLHTDVLGDPSRPALHRVTSQVERQVATSRSTSSDVGGSLRGSFDLLRMSAVDESPSTAAGEVEVLIHKVKPSESLAGIALLYGIDLPTLRKVNKLWASDPIHIRTHLYVPIEACRWNRASETLIRGPGEGQVTLAPKVTKWKGKGKERAYDEGKDINGQSTPHGSTKSVTSLLSDAKQEDGWGIDMDLHAGAVVDLSQAPSPSPAEAFMPSTNLVYEQQNHSHANHGFPSDSDFYDALGSRSSARAQDEHEHAEDDADDQTPRVLDVVRIPSSQLRFFPRAKPTTSSPSSRTSIDIHVDPNGLAGRLSLSDYPYGRESKDNVGSITSQRMSLRRSTSDTYPIESTPHGPMIVHDLSTLPPPLKLVNNSPPQPRTRSKTSNNVVRLRPPQAVNPSVSASNGIANRLSSFFTVPPPPPISELNRPVIPTSHGQAKGKSTPRISMDSNFSSARSSEAGSTTPASAAAGGKQAIPAKQEIMELNHIRRSSGLAGGGGPPDLGKIKARISSSRKKED